MAGRKHQEPDIVFTPAADLDAAVARYRVLIAGIARPGKAPLNQGDIATADEIGDTARVAKLLELGRIEEV